MTVERILRLAAGVFILISVALTRWIHPNWIYFTALIGLNLLQSAFTNWCPMMSILKLMGIKECSPEEEKV